jgi:hypothetical protein
MSMIIYVMVHIKRAEYIENNRRIQKIAREMLITTLANQMARMYHTVNVDDVYAVLPLCIEIGLHNPVTSHWIRLVGAMAKPLNITALIQVSRTSSLATFELPCDCCVCPRGLHTTHQDTHQHA